MHTYQSLVNEALETVAEIFPWDLEDIMGTDKKPLIVDIREPAKFTMARTSKVRCTFLEDNWKGPVSGTTLKPNPSS